jgi:hypothetical protein
MVHGGGAGGGKGARTTSKRERADLSVKPRGKLASSVSAAESAAKRSAASQRELTKAFDRYQAARLKRETMQRNSISARKSAWANRPR